MEYFDELNEVLRAAIEGLQVKPERISDQEIPVGISNRHIHLAKAELEKLFGAGYALTKMKDLSQKGQYAASIALQIRIRRFLQTIRSLILLIKILSLKILKASTCRR